MKKKRRRLRTPFVVTAAALAAACGTSANGGSGGSGIGAGGTSANGGSSGSGGTSANGGSSGSGVGAEGDASSAGSGGGGASPVCPATPPFSTPAEQCSPEVQQAGGCRYRVACQAGPVDLTFTCTTDGSSVVLWNVVPEACSFPYDSCAGTSVYCNGSAWATRAPANPPQPCPELCPEEKPAPGRANCLTCSADCSICSPGASCGYQCASGSGWSVGSSYRAGPGCANGVWLFDGACPGDCSKEERALYDFVSANKSCTTAADCTSMRSVCAFTKETCGGAFYVSASTDSAKWNEYDAALTACAEKPGSDWSCAVCNEVDAPPDCVSGRCVAKQ